MSALQQLYLAAVLLFAIFALVGLYVSRRPLILDARALWFRSQATRIALIFTVSGRSPALFAGYVIAGIVFLLAHLPIVIPLLLAASQVLSQTLVELLKKCYGRTRPGYWLNRLDAGHSFPSGHAATAVISFGAWAFVIGHSTLPVVPKDALVTLFVLWAIGIDWSRLALGAHYLSDVAGGTIFGCAWLCALLALGEPFLVKR